MFEGAYTMRKPTVSTVWTNAISIMISATLACARKQRAAAGVSLQLARLPRTARSDQCKRRLRSLRAASQAFERMHNTLILMENTLIEVEVSTLYQTSAFPMPPTLLIQSKSSI